MKQKLLSVGTCTFCDQGSVGIRVPDAGCCVIGLCDECDSAYYDKAMTDGPEYIGDGPGACRHGSSVFAGRAHWANWEEARRFGWEGAIVGEFDAL